MWLRCVFLLVKSIVQFIFSRKRKNKRKMSQFLPALRAHEKRSKNLVLPEPIFRETSVQKTKKDSLPPLPRPSAWSRTSVCITFGAFLAKIFVRRIGQKKTCHQNVTANEAMAYPTLNCTIFLFQSIRGTKKRDGINASVARQPRT